MFVCLVPVKQLWFDCWFRVIVKEIWFGHVQNFGFFQRKKGMLKTVGMLGSCFKSTVVETWITCFLCVCVCVNIYCVTTRHMFCVFGTLPLGCSYMINHYVCVLTCWSSSRFEARSPSFPCNTLTFSLCVNTQAIINSTTLIVLTLQHSNIWALLMLL